MKFHTLAAEERSVVLRDAADRLGLPAVILEKDFWVCWLLDRIFHAPGLAPHLVFKGGTSLSKVFGVIERFSEDIDLSVAPALLGWNEAELDDAPTATQRRKRFEELERDCADRVQGSFRDELEQAIRDLLGPKPRGNTWLNYLLDPASNSPVLFFEYPASVPSPGYIAQLVKMEFGSLTDQQPVGTHKITAMLAEAARRNFEDFTARVVALEIERTFWEKATILHAEYHRPPTQPMRDRFARHYSDMAALWRHPTRSVAMGRLDLLERVRQHKSRFFSSSWANYETAKPGTLKVRPPASREAELARDYARMEAMFLATPPPFSAILETLSDMERTINQGS